MDWNARGGAALELLPDRGTPAEDLRAAEPAIFFRPPRGARARPRLGCGPRLAAPGGEPQAALALFSARGRPASGTAGRSVRVLLNSVSDVPRPPTS